VVSASCCALFVVTSFVVSTAEPVHVVERETMAGRPGATMKIAVLPGDGIGDLKSSLKPSRC
jgi:hypothetical protein